MRPLELIMQGFGPFGGLERVDFSGFSGVFLITGDTGAGKTTIFDGVSYALFGETSGNARQVDSVRSHYAPEQEPTRVCLRFLQHGQVYEIERSPRYERIRKNGKGTAIQQPKVILTLPDGAVLTGKETVNRQIEELVGLNYKQFKQVAMIAQGEFLQLLLAGSDKRGEIFRKVFHTEDCQYLQAELKNRLSVLRRQAEDVQMRILGIMQEFEIPEEDGTAAELRESLQKKDPYLAGTLTGGIEEWNRRDEEERTDLEKRLKEIEIALASFRYFIQQQEKRKQLCIQLEEQAKKAAQQEERLHMAEQTLQSAGKQRLKIQELSGELLKLHQMEEARRQADSLRQLIENLSQKEETLINQEKRFHQRSKELAEELENGKKRLRELSGIQEAASACKLRQRELALEEEQIRRALDLSRECEKLAGELEDCQNEYLTTETAFQKAQSEAQHKEEIWLRAQAGILARNLREGEPCPVCGSRVHPARADLNIQIPDENERKLARQEAEKLRETMQERSRQAAGLRSRLQAQQGHLEQCGADLQRWEIVRGEQEKNNQELKKLQECLQELAFLHERSRLLEEEQKGLQTEFGQIEEKLKNAQMDRAAAQGALEREEERCAQTGLAELLQKEEAIRTRKHKMEEALEQAEDIRRQFDQKLQQERGILSGLRQSLKQYDEELNGHPTQQALKENIEALEKQQSEYRTRQKEIDGRLRGNRMALIRLREAFTQYRQSMERCQAMTTLSQTASGELAGRPKLAFEQYIQAFYFEYVLKAANQRLKILSRGQYTLLRRVQGGNLRSADGLELEVLDHYTGRRRPVSSLSGGESFQSALSLALGLSDVIQSFAGGIEVDAVFIDEGFGSLDQMALAQALEALARLSEGDRMVGIISHVELLKEKIPQQLEVVKTIGGSHIRQKIAERFPEDFFPGRS